MGSATTQEDRHKTNMDCFFQSYHGIPGFCSGNCIASTRKDSSNVQIKDRQDLYQALTNRDTNFYLVFWVEKLNQFWWLHGNMLLLNH